MTLWVEEVASPVGPLLLAHDGVTLRAVRFDGDPVRMARQFRSQPVAAATPSRFAARLRAYFAGEMTVLDDIPVRTDGSAFQEAVWAAMRKVPPGETISYGRLATQIGAPEASRAVGLAANQNPVVIVVPCHRVIGANGRLTGFGGGLPRKAWLLAHEAKAAGRPELFPIEPLTAGTAREGG